MAETTIPYILEHTFLRFGTYIPRGIRNGTSIYQVWSQTFENSQGIRSADLFMRIAQVSESLSVLEAQVSSSSSLTSARKSWANSTLKLFKPFVELEKINSAVFDFEANCTEGTCGSLGIIGASLAGEFSENVLTSQDAAELVIALQEARDLLDSDDLPLKLKIGLRRQLDAIIWRLQHPELESLQDAFEAIGKATLVANQMERLCPSDGTETNGAKVLKNLMTCFQKVQTLTEKGEKTYRTGKLLYEGIIKPLISE